MASLFRLGASAARVGAGAARVTKKNVGAATQGALSLGEIITGIFGIVSTEKNTRAMDADSSRAASSNPPSSVPSSSVPSSSSPPASNQSPTSDLFQGLLYTAATAVVAGGIQKLFERFNRKEPEPPLVEEPRQATSTAGGATRRTPTPTTSSFSGSGRGQTLGRKGWFGWLWGGGDSKIDPERLRDLRAARAKASGSDLRSHASSQNTQARRRKGWLDWLY